MSPGGRRSPAAYGTPSALLQDLQALLLSPCGQPPRRGQEHPETLCPTFAAPEQFLYFKLCDTGVPSAAWNDGALISCLAFCCGAPTAPSPKSAPGQSLRWPVMHPTPHLLPSSSGARKLHEEEPPQAPQAERGSLQGHGETPRERLHANPPSPARSLLSPCGLGARGSVLNDAPSLSCPLHTACPQPAPWALSPHLCGCHGAPPPPKLPLPCSPGPQPRDPFPKSGKKLQWAQSGQVSTSSPTGWPLGVTRYTAWPLQRRVSWGALFKQSVHGPGRRSLAPPVPLFRATSCCRSPLCCAPGELPSQGRWLSAEGLTAWSSLFWVLMLTYC